MHALILQGTQSGGVDPRSLELTDFENVVDTYPLVLDYAVPTLLTLDTFQNDPVFYDVDLELVVVTELTLTLFTNTPETYDVELQLLPFTAVNAETTALLAAYTGTYSTTDKLQIDTLITELKDAGVWSELDWYGNAHWAVNEHDALLNWVNPAQTLTKVGGAFWTQGVGLTGVNPAINSGRYKSGWNIASGPNAAATDFAMFASVTDIFAPQNNMLLMGNYDLVSSQLDGSYIILSPPANAGLAGANVAGGFGNQGYTIGTGVGVWGASHNGGTITVVKNGSQVDSEASTGSASFHSVEGICVVGVPPSSSAARSFGGTILYWGWGAHLSAAQFGSLETAYQTSLEPPEVGGPPDFPLDDIEGSIFAAYALRRLLSSYTGPLIRVRRNNDDAELDIGYDGNGVVDIAAINTFRGAATGVDIKRFYDQSTAARHLTQPPTNSNNPRVYESGAFLTVPNGQPRAKYSDNHFNHSTTVTWGGATALTWIAALMHVAAFGGGTSDDEVMIFRTAATNGNAAGLDAMYAGSNAQDWQTHDFVVVGGGKTSTNAPRAIAQGPYSAADAAVVVWDANLSSSRVRIGKDGVTQTLRASSLGNVNIPTSGTDFVLGSNWEPFKGNISECVLFAADLQDDADYAVYRANVMTFWQT
jgi:hypothetical protein